MKEYKTYQDKTNHFSIQYPENWIVEKDQGTLIFLSGLTGDDDKFRENVNIMVQDLTGHNLDLESYTELSKQLVIDNLSESAILEIADIRLCGYRAKEFKYQMAMDGNELIILQNWFLMDNKAYLFSFTAEKESFDAYINKARDIFNSFRFIKG